MHLTRLFAGSAVALASVLAGFHSAPAWNRITPEGMEVRRIRAHFDSALAELSARDVAELTLKQQATRARLLEILRVYRDRGIFPHNYDFPGRAVPYFIDRKTGTLCAVAHLLASTGRQIRIARLLGREQPPTFLHHPLIMKTSEQKLSKSDGDTGVRELRARGWSPADAIEAAIAGGARG